MNLAATLALVAAAIALYVAGLSLRFALAPGWDDQRWFALVAVAIAGYALLDVPFSMTAAAPALVVSASRAQLFLVGVHQLAWLRYSELDLGVPPHRLARALGLVALVSGAAALAPGIAYDGALAAHAWPSLGITYRDPVPTPGGNAIFAVQGAAVLLVAWRYARAWWRGSRHAFGHAAALLLVLVMGLSDGLVASGILETPYLLVFGLIVPVATVGYSVTSRFSADARALAELRLRLEALVEERTRELASAQEALHRSEKLAALGQFAAGVAHEVNNPAAAVAANLRYLSDRKAAEGAFPADSEACLAESLTAVDRIAHVVRQLRDASRSASGAPSAPVGVALAVAVEEALVAARARCGARVELASEVGPGVRALAQEQLLVQVLVNLIVNGAQAIPERRQDGRVVVRAERGPGRVRLVVEDDGEGMSADVLRRAFEPFFSTRPVGAGTGLGLSVAAGLVESMGGQLRLESTPGRGTQAVVDLAEAPAEAARPALAVPAPAPARV